MQRSKQHTLLYSAQCPNCSRFIDALSRTSAAAEVAVVDVATLHPSQLARVSAVPALVLAGGRTVYGTQAFEWLKQYEADVDLDGFEGENGALAFSDVSSAQGYVNYAQSYSAFQPVQD
jgi:hypothetical protein